MCVYIYIYIYIFFFFFFFFFFFLYKMYSITKLILSTSYSQPNKYLFVMSNL